MSFDHAGLQNASTSTQPVPNASNKEQDLQSLYDRLKKALPGLSQPSAQQPRTSVFDRLTFPQTSQPETPKQQDQMPAPQRMMQPPELQYTTSTLSGPLGPVAEQTSMSVFDRLTSAQTSQPKTPATKKQTPAPQHMMRPPVLQDTDFVLPKLDTPLSRISEASESALHAYCLQFPACNEMQHLLVAMSGSCCVESVLCSVLTACT